MRAIGDLGYEKPSPIQEQTLPILLGDKTDFIGLAATGTGKTAAFGIPLLEKIDLKATKAVQALILCPTRELAIQVAGQIDLLGKHKGIYALPIYGGASYGDQIRGLRQGVSVVVGTPGRVVDHLDRGTLSLAEVHTVVLDEADEMISMGFKEDLETILSGTNREESNIWLFSATMSREVRHIADDYLTEPKQVQVNRTEMLPSTIEQLYYSTHESNKPEVLCKLIDQADDFYGLIFCQTKSLVTDLTAYLTARGYQVDCLHGDKDQRGRERTMQAFRDRKVSMLVCTDVASRGLDVKDVTHVINYSIPRELDNYVHRIGRTARSGKTGFAFSLVTPANKRLISRIEEMTKSRMKEGKIPTRKDVGSKKISQVLPKFLAQDLHARAVDLMGTEWTDAINEMSKEEIVGRFLTLNHTEIFADKSEVTMPGPQARDTSDPRDRDNRRERSRSRDRDGGGERRGFGFGGRRDDRREDRGGRRDFGGRRDERRDFKRDDRPRFDRPERDFGNIGSDESRTENRTETRDGTPRTREDRREFAVKREARFQGGERRAPWGKSSKRHDDRPKFGAGERPKSVYSNTFSKKPARREGFSILD